MAGNELSLPERPLCAREPQVRVWRGFSTRMTVDVDLEGLLIGPDLG